MFVLGVLCATLMMLVCITAIGLLITECFPARLRPIGRAYFSPILGLSVFIPLATAVGWTSPFSFLRCLIPTLVLAGFGLWRFRGWRPLMPLLSRVLGVGLVGSAAVIAPIVLYGSFNSMNDTFTYIEHAQWLQTHSFAERAVGSGNFPAVTQIVLYQTAGHRMGASFFLAWFQAMFKFAWSYHAYPAAVLVPLIAGSIAVGGAVRLVTRRGHVVPWLMALFTATALNGWSYGASYGFFPQTFGLAFACGALSVLGASFAHQLSRQRLPDWQVQLRESLPAAMLFAAFTFTYNDLLPFVLLAVGVFVLGTIGRRWQTAGRVLALIGWIVVEGVVIINVEAVRILNNFLHTVLGVGTGNVRFGWPVAWAPWEFAALAFGLRHSVPEVWLLIGQYATVALFVVLLFCMTMAVGTRIRAGRVSPILLLNGLLVATFFGAFLYFRYALPGLDPNEVGHTFIQFKLGKWASPSCAVLIGVALTDIWRRGRTASVVVVVSLVTFIVLGINRQELVAKNVTPQMNQQTGYSGDAFDELLALRELTRLIPATDVIYLNLGAENHKLRQLVSYVLWDRKLASDYRDDGYIVGSLPASDRSMQYDQTQWAIEFSPAEPQAPMQYARAGNLILRPRPPVLISLHRVDGGHSRESDGPHWWHWTADQVAFTYNVLGGPTKRRLHFRYVPATEGRIMTISVGGEHPSTFTVPLKGGWNDYDGPEIEVSSPAITVTFSTDQPGVKEGTDPRVRAFLVGDVQFDAVSGETTGAAAGAAIDAPAPPAVPEIISAVGGYGRETEPPATWRYWVKNEIVFKASAPATMSRARLRFTYMPGAQSRKLTVSVESEGKKASSFTVPMNNGWNEFVSPTVPASGPMLTIRMSADGEPVRLGPADPRMVTFLIQNLEILPDASAPVTPPAKRKGK